MQLDIQHITKHFSGYPALEDINFEIPDGCIFGLLGPNGAGKTTLLRILNQIIPADHGQILSNGSPMAFSDTSRIGYLPEERGLYKKMKVEEQLLYLARLKGMPVKAAKAHLSFWFQKLDVMGWKNRKPDQLSKGMQQKVQFIATVAHDPDLIILDEPFSGFDPVNADLLKKEITGLKKKGKTIILSTHNMVSVEELCDEIALINSSNLVLKGNLSFIRQQYASGIFRLRLKKTDLCPEENPDYQILSLCQEEEYMELRVRNINKLPENELLRFFMKTFDILSFQQERMSMNDIFLQAVGK